MSTGYIRGNMQERTMEFIPTTATAAEKLKRLAKTLRKSTKSSLAVALDAIARQHGYRKAAEQGDASAQLNLGLT